MTKLLFAQVIITDNSLASLVARHFCLIVVPGRLLDISDSHYLLGK